MATVIAQSFAHEEDVLTQGSIEGLTEAKF